MDPKGVHRPNSNEVRAPIYKSGDFVPLDPVLWRLAVREELKYPRGGGLGPYGLEYRGEFLLGWQQRYLYAGNGLAVCPGGWRGFLYE